MAHIVNDPEKKKKHRTSQTKNVNQTNYFPVARDRKGRGFEFRPVRFQVTALGKLLHAPFSIIWYRPMGGDAYRMGRQPQAWRKVMAAYCRVDGFKSPVGLTACTPGSAPGPTLGNEYGRTLLFTL